MNLLRSGALLLSAVMLPNVLFAQTDATGLLKLETTIPLPDVNGRIDHLSIDLKGQRLFVAALGSNSLEVIDLKDNKRVHTITGLAEPQGIAYLLSHKSHFRSERQRRLSPRIRCQFLEDAEIHSLRR